MTTSDELLETIASMGPEEKRVMLILAKRLLAGQQTFGQLHLATDPRNWLAERSLEVQDLLVYTAFAQLAAELRK